MLRQDVFLEPIASEVVFAAPRLLRLTMATSAVAVDDMGAVSVSSAGARLRYTVESEVEGPTVRGAGVVRPAPALDGAQLERYRQLPVLAPAIPALARQVAGTSRDPAEIARRLEAFLRQQFRYTLDIERVSQLDPLQEFLLVRRAGHCEYFAAAMAVMLRSLGVPARVVNGFQRGEWNPYGQYYIVRYYDAHSWVEAYLPDAGWVSFDPTPRASFDALASRTPMLLYLDSLRLRWHRYVVNWTLRDQIHAVQAVQLRLAGLRGWSTGLDPETRARLGRGGALALVVAVGAVGAWVAWQHSRRRPRAPRVARARLLSPCAARRCAARPPARDRGDRARVQRSRVPSGTRSGIGVHARDGALRARSIRRDAADPRRARGGRGLAGDPRARTAMSPRPPRRARSGSDAT